MIYSHFCVTEFSLSLVKLVLRLPKSSNSSISSTFVSHSLISDGSTFNTDSLKGDDGKLFNILQNSSLSPLFVPGLHKEVLEGFTKRQMQQHRKQSEDDALSLERWPFALSIRFPAATEWSRWSSIEGSFLFVYRRPEIICCAFCNHQCNCDLEVKPIQHFIHGFNYIQLIWKLKQHQLLYVSSGIFKHKHTSQLVYNFPEAILLFQ